MRYRRFCAQVLVLGVLIWPATAAISATTATIDVPGATSTIAFGINNRGQIVGIYVSGGRDHGFLLDHGTFVTIDVPGASSTNIFGINDRGRTVGVYGADGGVHGFGSF